MNGWRHMLCMNRTERCINIGLSISLNIFEIISPVTNYFADPFKGIMKAQLFLFLCFRARIFAMIPFIFCRFALKRRLPNTEKKGCGTAQPLS